MTVDQFDLEAQQILEGFADSINEQIKGGNAPPETDGVYNLILKSWKLTKKANKAGKEGPRFNCQWQVIGTDGDPLDGYEFRHTYFSGLEPGMIAALALKEPSNHSNLLAGLNKARDESIVFRCKISRRKNPNGGDPFVDIRPQEAIAS